MNMIDNGASQPSEHAPCVRESPFEARRAEQCVIARPDPFHPFFEPFGRTTTAGSSGNSFQYTGRENDGTGLSYYRARYYQPRLQRFIGEDPIGFAGGDVNLYAYVLNNPTRFIDPLGLDWFRPPSEGYFAGRRDKIGRASCRERV